MPFRAQPILRAPYNLDVSISGAVWTAAASPLAAIAISSFTYRK